MKMKSIDIIILSSVKDNNCSVLKDTENKF